MIAARFYAVTIQLAAAAALRPPPVHTKLCCVRGLGFIVTSSSPTNFLPVSSPTLWLYNYLYIGVAVWLVFCSSQYVQHCGIFLSSALAWLLLHARMLSTFHGKRRNGADIQRHMCKIRSHRSVGYGVFGRAMLIITLLDNAKTFGGQGENGYVRNEVYF